MAPPKRLMRLLAVALLVIAGTSRAEAQDRRYLIELGAAGGYTSFGDATLLKGSGGGLARLAFWTPFRVSLEAEAGMFSPSARSGADWSARSFSGSLLYNVGIGSSSSVFLRAGYAAMSYDSDLCTGIPPRSLFGVCGSSGALTGGTGARIGITPTIMVRADGFAMRSSSGDFTNLGASLGVAVMLGSKPLTDEDGDGVYDFSDDCPGTAAGALADGNGCPTDSDGDGVSDGLDRCPSTEAGTAVDGAGCPRDEDADIVPDGLDKCPNTPAGAAVDKNGCPLDTDGDKIFDGLDRCPATPLGASVDQLGCPGDSDGDGVLDGLDRCPRTPPDTPVNAAGCPNGSAPGQGSGASRRGANPNE